MYSEFYVDSEKHHFTLSFFLPELSCSLSLSLPTSLSFPLQRGVSVKRGCVMETVTVRIILMRIIAKRCCVNSRTMFVPITILFAFLPKSCAMARTTVPMAQMRNSVVSTFSLTHTMRSTRQRMSWNGLFAS